MDNNTIKENLNNEFFLKGEIFKRYFEEYGKKSDIKWLNKNCFIPNELKLYTKEQQNLIIRELINKHEKTINKEEYIPSNGLKFTIIPNQSWISRLYDISKKYTTYAPELLQPYKTTDILSAIDNNEKLPSTELFEKELTIDEVHDKYGYYMFKSQNQLFHTIDLSIENKNNITKKISEEIAIFKITNNIPLTDNDTLNLKTLIDYDRNTNARSNSFRNRMLGLYIWDTLKEFGCTIKKAKENLIKLNLYQYNNKTCSPDQCNTCNSLDNCDQYFEFHYKIAAKSIYKKKIISTSEKPGKVKKPTLKLRFKRIELDYFSHKE